MASTLVDLYLLSPTPDPVRLCTYAVHYDAMRSIDGNIGRAEGFCRLTPAKMSISLRYHAEAPL